MRAWLIVAMSSFLCPSTCLRVSPRCYPSFINLEDVVNINFCQFVVDRLQVAFKNLGDEKNSLRCCVYLLPLLHLDSLIVDEPLSNCAVCNQAWTTQAINKVVQQDMIACRVYGETAFESTSWTWQ
ncbi:hypothetical protein BRADI_5g05228v3 [Brachypodium distachyon]|uniref:Uncharacterized protein n=1 Tax=Brachypodium distachyon TaxID=15368 RepID=A0A0Q3E725_BRADI|nr:hypothetical protein BRADI_5g05228v3 [Brachypodium distachyon]